MNDIDRSPRLTIIDDPLDAARTRRALACRAGQWLSEAAQEDTHHGDWIAVDGGRVIPRSEWPSHLLRPGAEILLYPQLSDNPSQVLLGIAFPPLGIYYGMRALGAPSWVSALSMGAFGGGLGTALAVQSGVESVLAGSPIQSLTSDTAGSPTYSFDGIRTSTRIGAPIPVVYGTHRLREYNP